MLLFQSTMAPFIKLLLPLILLLGFVVVSSVHPAPPSFGPGEPPLLVREWNVERDGTLIATLANDMLIRFQVLFGDPAPECSPIRVQSNEIKWTTPGEHSYRYTTGKEPFAYKDGVQWIFLIQKTYEHQR